MEKAKKCADFRKSPEGEFEQYCKLLDRVNVSLTVKEQRLYQGQGTVYEDFKLVTGALTDDGEGAFAYYKGMYEGILRLALLETGYYLRDDVSYESGVFIERECKDYNNRTCVLGETRLVIRTEKRIFIRPIMSVHSVQILQSKQGEFEVTVMVENNGKRETLTIKVPVLK